MGVMVVNNAVCKCSFGAAPSALGVLPVNKVMASSLPAATIMDHIPFVNVRPFAMCKSLANPKVLKATIANKGVLTPQPCTPITPAPWIVGKPTILIGGKPALDDSGKLMCVFAGVINVVFPGQVSVLV